MSELNLSAWALRNRSVIAFFMMVAVAAGLASYFRLGRSEDPSFIIKTMVVQAAWPGASVEDTLKQVTERLERGGGVGGVQRSRRRYSGRSNVKVERLAVASG